MPVDWLAATTLPLTDAAFLRYHLPSSVTCSFFLLYLASITTRHLLQCGQTRWGSPSVCWISSLFCNGAHTRLHSPVFGCSTAGLRRARCGALVYRTAATPLQRSSGVCLTRRYKTVSGRFHTDDAFVPRVPLRQRQRAHCFPDDHGALHISRLGLRLHAFLRPFGGVNNPKRVYKLHLFACSPHGNTAGTDAIPYLPPLPVLRRTPPRVRAATTFARRIHATRCCCCLPRGRYSPLYAAPMDRHISRCAIHDLLAPLRCPSAFLRHLPGRAFTAPPHHLRSHR